MYVLIKKTDFEALVSATKNEIINISTSNFVTEFPLYNLSSTDWYLVQACSQSARGTYLYGCEIINKERIQSIIASGTYSYP